MEVPKIIKWQHDNIKVTGVSVAGIGTCLYLPEIGTCLDVAQGLNFAFPAKNFLITHPHMDHAAGIPYLISQKALLKQSPPIFYMPQPMIAPLIKIIAEWSKIEGHHYEFEFLATTPTLCYKLQEPYSFIPFETFHRTPSQGYTIYETRKKLKKEFQSKKESEILELKNKGIEVSEPVHLPIFSYTGDTQIEFWKKNPEVLKSKILFVETTYWDDKKSIMSAREWGHIHFDEILPLLFQFKGEKLVFMHISSRYRPEYIYKIIKSQIPQDLQQKVDLFY